MLFTVKLKLDSEMHMAVLANVCWNDSKDVRVCSVSCPLSPPRMSTVFLGRGTVLLPRCLAASLPPKAVPLPSSHHPTPCPALKRLLLLHYVDNLVTTSSLVIKKIQKQRMPGFRRALTIGISRATVILSAAYSSRFGKRGDGVTHG